MRRLLILSLLFAAAAPTALALNTHDTTVVVPIIGRFPGALGSQWRTDLFIANHFSPAPVVTLRFYVAGGAPLVRTATLPAFGAVSMRDVVLSTFGLATASGQLVLTSTGTFEARARIYNSGNAAGEFGQGVPGLGMVTLRKQAFVYGLSGINGNRVNIGVANPNDTAVTVTTRVTNATNDVLHTRTDTLAPHETKQFNDIFAAFGIALQADMQVEFNSTTEARIYGYASEVRNDTGDAIFLFGTGPNV